MAIKQPTIQHAKKSGHISPQVLLIHYETTERMTTLHFEKGVIMEAGLFNTHTMKQERPGKFRWHGPITIYLFPTDKLPGWCYVAMWDNYAQTYACSCFERKSGDCSHCIALDRLDSILF